MTGNEIYEMFRNGGDDFSFPEYGETEREEQLQKYAISPVAPLERLGGVEELDTGGIGFFENIWQKMTAKYRYREISEDYRDEILKIIENPDSQEKVPLNVEQNTDPFGYQKGFNESVVEPITDNVGGLALRGGVGILAIVLLGLGVFLFLKDKLPTPAKLLKG